MTASEILIFDSQKISFDGWMTRRKTQSRDKRGEGGQQRVGEKKLDRQDRTSTDRGKRMLDRQKEKEEKKRGAPRGDQQLKAGKTLVRGGEGN